MTGRLVSARLVGRRRELDVLADAVAQVRAADGPLFVLVAGEAGVGKTRLVEEALSSLVPTDVRVLVGRCVELGGAGRPLAPLVDILRALVATTATDDLDELLGIARAEFARLLPDLDRSALPPALGGDLGAPARLFELLLGVLGRLALDRPLVVVMEDLHWADRSTIDLLVFLARTVPSPVCYSLGPIGPMSCTDGTRSRRPSRSWRACAASRCCR